MPLNKRGERPAIGKALSHLFGEKKTWICECLLDNQLCTELCEYTTMFTGLSEPTVLSSCQLRLDRFRNAVTFSENIAEESGGAFAVLSREGSQT